MRYFFCLLLVPAFFLGCRKGKTLPEIVYVHYEGPSNVGISPQGAFSHFDPFDFTETDHYPSYVDTDDAPDLASDFNEYLTQLLKKNNIILTSEPADYTLKVTYLGVGESLERETYFDSCSNSTAYVYYSSLDAEVKAYLYKNGFELDSWDRNASSSENLKGKTDSCNQPKVRRIFRGPSSLCDQLARELRVKVSKKLYELEVE